ncbi:Rieske 2Fe-2S domain-containing protein [Methylocystis iwaonis]|uniref:Rieske 2Fe-2S domain-containing protein n=1 Tax=Methylocystis iwaonis TaxID=2885079 RepID=UPI002E7ADFED|nr:Rieske 2Fe-2S domain-containing protein [Methylocystis iwaonis]
MSSLTDVDFEHTGPGCSAGVLLRRFWQPVFVSEELKVAHPVPLKILGEELTLYRGEDNVAHIVEGRCPHRGLVLSVGKVEGDSIRCRYHGWQFDASGRCVEQPFEPKCFSSKVRLRSYPVEEYFGLIWAYLGPDPAPPLPRWPGLERYGYFHVVEQRKWNYFHDLENTVDDVHQRWVHAEGIYQDAGNAGEIPASAARATDYGLMQYTSFPSGYLRKLALFMPNMLYFNSGAGVLRGFKSFLWNVPIDDVSHKMFFIFIATHLSPEEGRNVADGVRAGLRYVETLPSVENVVDSVLSGRMRWEDVDSRPDLVLIEDGIVLKGQGVIPDRSKNRLGSSDAAIILLRKLYAREIARIERGEPPAVFSVPDESILSQIDEFQPEPA